MYGANITTHISFKIHCYTVDVNFFLREYITRTKHVDCRAMLQILGPWAVTIFHKKLLVFVQLHKKSFWFQK
jgi:predicted amidophosphoribosyltransferase